MSQKSLNDEERGGTLANILCLNVATGLSDQFINCATFDDLRNIGQSHSTLAFRVIGLGLGLGIEFGLGLGLVLELGLAPLAQVV